MISELSFLIELLLKHKLPPATKDLIATRIKDVEEHTRSSHTIPFVSNRPVAPGGVAQAASMQAIMDRNPDLVTQPVAVIAQTPETAAAMNSRNTAIAESMAGKVDKVTGRPRKF